MWVVFLLVSFLKSSDAYADSLFASTDSNEERLAVKLKELQSEMKEMKGKWLASEISNKMLRTEMLNMNKRLTETDTAMKVRIQQLEEKLKPTPCKDSVEQKEDQRSISNTQDFSSTNISKDERLGTDLHRRLLMPDSNHRIAFTAVLTHDVTLGFHQPIEFDKVITNIGNAYDPSDGHFIATIRGLYLLSTSIVCHNDGPQPIEMVRNGIQLSSMFLDRRNYNMGSQTIVVVLEKGDKIWVRRYRDTGSASLYARPNEPGNSFSGVLLYDM